MIRVVGTPAAPARCCPRPRPRPRYGDPTRARCRNCGAYMTDLDSMRCGALAKPELTAADIPSQWGRVGPWRVGLSVNA